MFMRRMLCPIHSMTALMVRCEVEAACMCMCMCMCPFLPTVCWGCHDGVGSLFGVFQG